MLEALYSMSGLLIFIGIWLIFCIIVGIIIYIKNLKNYRCLYSEHQVSVRMTKAVATGYAKIFNGIVIRHDDPRAERAINYHSNVASKEPEEDSSKSSSSGPIILITDPDKNG
jgi:hypothetical protein